MPGHEFQELRILEERARIGNDVSIELGNLIKSYNEAKKHAEDLLRQIEDKKRALKIRSYNLPVTVDEEEHKTPK
jgi:ArsR family transcriptional regulator